MNRGNYLQALILFENRHMSKEVSQLLERLGFSVTRATSATNLVRLIQEKNILIAMFDHQSKTNPETLLKKIQRLSPTTQLIMVSNSIPAHSALRWINQGGFACFKKPLDYNNLIRKLTPLTSILKNQQFLLETHRSLGEKLRKESKSLSREIHKDGLTGLLDKKYFHSQGEKILNESQAQKRNLSLIVLDIDNFKLYNDTHGHPQGDKALRKLGKIIRDEVRDSDLPGRIGGEEFSIMLLGTDPFSTKKFCERLRKKVEEATFKGQEVLPDNTLTISLGFSSYPHHADDFNRLMELADRATYQSKRLQRNKTTATVIEKLSLLENKNNQYQKVSVVGEYNAWDPESDTLQRVGRRRWEKNLPVPEGTLRYAYCLNGDGQKLIPDPERGKKIEDEEGRIVTEMKAG